MKILNRSEFLSLPEGILFQKYHPCIFGDMSIKGESWENDFWYTSLNDNVYADSSDDMFDILNAAENKKTSFRMDYNVESRDGLFDNLQLFVVYDKVDVMRLLGAIGGVYQNMLELEKSNEQKATEKLVDEMNKEMTYMQIPWLRYLDEVENNV